MGLTIESYWDCNCEKDYIHDKSLEKECTICGAKEEEQPDSHTEEVIAKFKETNDELVNALRGFINAFTSRELEMAQAKANEILSKIDKKDI